MEKPMLNIVLTPEQAQFTFEALTRSPLPYLQVHAIVEALLRAAQQARKDQPSVEPNTSQGN